MNQPFVIATVLGLVQGLTEFIPISSSGHLVIVRELFSWADQGNFFDAVLHLATLLAILVYFRHDWAKMLRAAVKAPGRSQRGSRRLFWLIIAATIPAVVIGPMIEPWIGEHFRSIWPVALLMILAGAVFWLVERLVSTKGGLASLSPARAIGIGLAQALAMVHGLSRSGLTIATGLYMGLARDAAARFSFLIAAPVVALAGGYSLYQAIREGLLNWSDYQFWLVAFIVSFISGLMAIKFLLTFLKKHSLNLFAYYMVLAGSALLVFHFWR